MNRYLARLTLILGTLGGVAAMLCGVGSPYPADRLRPQPSSREDIDRPIQPVAQTSPQPKLYPVWLNGKTGFIDSTGKLVIPAKFDYLIFTDVDSGIFSDGIARIKVDAGRSPVTTLTKYLNGFIDATGKVVVPPQYEEAENFSEGLAAVKVSTGREGYRTTEDRYGYIDHTGWMAIPARFYVAGNFSEGVANA